jgi:hypothetical protein
MADEAHLSQLKQGVEAWNQWRAANHAIRPDLSGARLSGAAVRRANLTAVNLSGASLRAAVLVETNLERANLTGCSVYGLAAWNVNLVEAQQSDLVITRFDEPEITVDNLEVAQFIYLLLHNCSGLRTVYPSGLQTGACVGQRSVRRHAPLGQRSGQMSQHSCAKGLQTRPWANTPCERGKGWNINAWHASASLDR